MAGKKKTKQEKVRKHPFAVVREYVELVLEVLLVVFFINTFLLQSQNIPSSSMEKTMLVGDHLLVNKSTLAPTAGKWESLFLPRTTIRRGMIITFKGPTEPGKDYIKRVIALPGETIRIENKKVFINGEPLEEPYLYWAVPGRRASGDYFPLKRSRPLGGPGETTYLPFYVLNRKDRMDAARGRELCRRFNHCVQTDQRGRRVFKVPPDHYFCMGDNRDNSYDSRFWGPLPRDYVLGKPWVIYWSYPEIAPTANPTSLDKLKDMLLSPVRFITQTRWKRTFKQFD